MRRVSGSLVEVDGLASVAISELLALGCQQLPGEVVAIRGDSVTAQAYETTAGLAVGDPAVALGRPLSARLGPDLLGGVFDGLLRPLSDAPVWLTPRSDHPGVDTLWAWQPSVAPGAEVHEGSVLGIVPEVSGIEYRILVPPGVHGVVEGLAGPGRYRGDDVLATVSGTEVHLAESWPVRLPRPVGERLDTVEPLLTGQRVLDALFPVAQGGSASVPGGFGTGKTMLLQQVAKWCTADVIVYIGCGERGNEMADVLAEFAQLVDPRTQRALEERTVIIANTSNMPLMAREASIYTGVTVAEHFRDMGYHAVVIADSTSRWAEALREFGSRTGALPAEEGYPASLGSAISAFYERAARVRTLGGHEASVTILGAVSPPGGDVTEPVTTLTQRAVRGVWSLDRNLAYARHYPAVGWAGSFSRDAERLARWYAENGDLDWTRRRARLAGLLAEADRLGDLAELVGATSLPAPERMTLLAGRLLREGVLQQSALSANDAHYSPAKTAALIDAVLAVVDACNRLVAQDVPAVTLEEFDFGSLLRAAEETAPDDAAGVTQRGEAVLAALAALGRLT
ncbi:V-type ATP synthase subunit A [Nocardioides sp.]|uniref:V-type ATP synthase subunit A n=1 Tax=Nocardioides sp. TaxID=35761 RepID=UPI0035684E3B